MKHLLLPLCLLLSAPAMADVQLYGNIKSGIEASQTKYRGQSHSHSGVSDFGSYVGLRGSHPIGGGNVLWQMEQDAPLGSSHRDTSLRRQWQQRKGSGESFIGIER